MPELPEVQTIVTTLAKRIVGGQIRAVRLNRDDIVTPAGCDLAANLTGRRIASITRRAKRIVITLDDDNRFYIHLGMSGRLTIETPDAPLLLHTHLILDLEGEAPAEPNPLRKAARREPRPPSYVQRVQVRFRDPRRFGGIWWLGKDSHEQNVGPEPLTLRASDLAKRLAKTKRAIKAALLDQTLIAGLGNIYVDEALFAAKIHPKKRADKLNGEQVRRLNEAIKHTLRRAIHHRGSTLRDYVDADGVAGKFRNLHRVYHRAGLPCLTCGNAIARIVLAGRSTHFCPVCQRRR